MKNGRLLRFQFKNAYVNGTASSLNYIKKYALAKTS